MAKKQKSEQRTYFAPYGALPQEKKRTPEWDLEEEELFSDAANDEYLKSIGMDYTRDGIYYLDSNGKYLPGVIYYNNDGKWNHYKLTPSGVRGFNNQWLDQKEYQLLQTLGINPGRFFENGQFPQEYIPLDPRYIQSQLPNPIKQYRVGNSTIEQISTLPTSTIRNQNDLNHYLNNYLDHPNYHVIDPDNGYDFNISNGMYRDGGSRYIHLYGTYPKEWEDYDHAIYKAADPSKKQSAEETRNALNELFKNYNIQFKQGGKLIPKKHYLSI